MKIIKKIFQNNGNDSTGAVLIEFAFSIPILVIVLYFALDLPKHVRWKSHIKNAAYQAANLLQNVSLNRTSYGIGKKDENNAKKITLKDIKNVGDSWPISIFSSKNKWISRNALFQEEPTAYFFNDKLFFLDKLVDLLENVLVFPVHADDNGITGYNFVRPVTCVYYVKGTESNKAKVMWAMYYPSGGDIQVVDATNQINAYTDVDIPKLLSDKILSLDSTYDAKDIHKDLKISEDGEVKIIVLLFLELKSNGEISQLTRPSLGFYLLSPKESLFHSDSSYGFYKTAVIFSPKPALFNEEAPGI